MPEGQTHTNSFILDVYYKLEVLIRGRYSLGVSKPIYTCVIPITLSDTHYGHTQEDTHYTK
jgi:hypothetical protein